MSAYDLLAAIGQVDETAVLQARQQPHRASRGWLRWGSIAACICLLSAVTVGALFLILNRGDAGGIPVDSGGNAPGQELPLLDATYKTSPAVHGMAVKFGNGMSGGTPSSGSIESAPPAFQFNFGYIAVVAKAAEELPGVYQTLNEYGSTITYRYRVFRMEVVDPLESGMNGSFYYALPAHLGGDLTQYDALLMSMQQRGRDFILRHTETNVLTAFSFLFCDPFNTPELGNIIAFCDNVFDESLWQESSWIYGYQWARYQLDAGEGYDDMLVYRGSTLSDALATRQRIKAEWGQWDRTATVERYEPRSSAAQAALDYIKPFDNGIFIQESNGNELMCRRYIGVCPTNEWICIDSETEEVTHSEFSFEDTDFENLPDLAAYIEALDLASFAPQHTNTAGKRLMSNTAVGWYEKTADGVHAIVKIAWTYYPEDSYDLRYYDETFLLLRADGARVISREELIDLIGENRNIGDGQYGQPIEMPYA